MTKSTSNQELVDGHCPVCHGEGKFLFRNRDLMFDGNQEFEYHRCQVCEAIFQYPIPTAEETASFYPDHYSPYRSPDKLKFPSSFERAILKKYDGYNHLQTNVIQDLVAPITYPIVNKKRIQYIHPIQYVKDGRALDVGCGSGKFLLQLKQLGWRVQGVEFNKGVAEACRHNGLDVFHGELLDSNFPAASFDLITAHHLLEHLPNPNPVFDEMARIIKPDGQLLIRTPNVDSLGCAMFGKYWSWYDVPRHLVLYNPNNLTKLANQHGFSVEFMSVVPYKSCLLYSFDYLIGNRGKPSIESKFKKWLTSPYYPLSKLLRRGDEIMALYRKH
jgi:SAM-dependent methyltransferase